MKNTINKIFDVNKINILKQISCDEKYINGSASDFELFDEWERLIPFMAGHSVLAKYKSELSELGLPVPAFGEYSVELTCQRWRRINYGLGMDDGELSPRDNRPKKCEEIRSNAIKLNEYDLRKSVSNFVINCNNFAQLSEMICEDFFLMLDSVNSLYINVSGLDYKRPDPYAADQAFKKIKCDEKLNSQESLVFIAELLIDLLIRLKGKQDILLHFGTEGDIGGASELVSYLCRRSFAEGDVMIDVDPSTDTNTLSALVEDVYPQVRIIPNLRLCGDSFCENDLRCLFAKYPIGAFRIDRVCDKDLVESVIKSISDREEHGIFLKKILFEA